jgi:hypothetical protein
MCKNKFCTNGSEFEYCERCVATRKKSSATQYLKKITKKKLANYSDQDKIKVPELHDSSRKKSKKTGAECKSENCANESKKNSQYCEDCVIEKKKISQNRSYDKRNKKRIMERLAAKSLSTKVPELPDDSSRKKSKKTNSDETKEEVPGDSFCETKQDETKQDETKQDETKITELPVGDSSSDDDCVSKIRRLALMMMEELVSVPLRDEIPVINYQSTVLTDNLSFAKPMVLKMSGVDNRAVVKAGRATISTADSEYRLLKFKLAIDSAILHGEGVEIDIFLDPLQVTIQTWAKFIPVSKNVIFEISNTNNLSIMMNNYGDRFKENEVGVVLGFQGSIFDGMPSAYLQEAVKRVTYAKTS